MGSRAEDLLALLSDTSDEGENAQSTETGPQEDQPKTVSGILDKSHAFSKKSAFRRQDAHPLVLDMILLDRFGPEWLTWEPETVWSEIEAEFGVSPGVHARNKINALKTMHVVDTPWSEWEVFSVVCQALVDNIPDFKMLQKPSVSDVIRAVTIMKKVKSQDFSEEVGRYIAACFLDDSVIFLPEPVEFAQPYAEMPRYRCTQCGNVDTDTENEMCDSCGAPQRFLEKGPTHDPAPVRERYGEVKKAGESRNFWLTETAEDIQVAKLLSAEHLVAESESRLQDQLKAVRNEQ